MATQVELAIAWAKNLVGTAQYSGRCQAFVADCYFRGAGMARRSASTAKAARNLWRVSTSRSGIPAGAAVYFDSPTAPTAGHVGLCIGNDQIIHAFGKIKLMSVDSVIGAGYKYQGWGWNGGVKPTGAGAAVSTAISADSVAGTSGASLEETAVMHIPQTEQVWTAYQDDSPHKRPDDYILRWQSYETGAVQEITDRVGEITLTDDSDSLCLELSFQVLQVTGEPYFPPLAIACGDQIAAVNTGSGECVFLGQVQTVSGNYREAMTVKCLDGGRLLTTNDVIIQFNNVPAKTALTQLAAKVGIEAVSCPNLISTVYSVEKNNTATIAQSILDTVTAENGVPYFLRMVGGTLVVRSFGATCIRGWHKQAANLASFDILDEASDPQVSWDIGDLRNHVTVYSEADDSVSIQATAQDEDSIRRYGKRQALETFSDEDAVTAAAKAKSTLINKNRVEETFSVTTYGSDRVVAGVRLRVDLAEIQGEFWVVAVTHTLGPPHRMNMTLRRAD